MAYIELPRDQYSHPDNPPEWWWHIGTLRSGPRTFGFEIAVNGNSEADLPAVFVQIMLSDAQTGQHYQITTGIPYRDDWAESDDTKDWFARMDSIAGPHASVHMTAPKEEPTNMSVKASFADIATSTLIKFDLQLRQHGRPLLVWGDGSQEGNFYYSLTNLQVSGSLWIDDEELPVTGVTWMDHEWGTFPAGTAWILQDMQLDNGVCISNFASNLAPVLNKPMKSNATILDAQGNSTFVESVTTPLAPIWMSADKRTYFLRWHVSISGPVTASFTVTSLVAEQAFTQTVAVYEGAARVEGVYAGQMVTGTAWNEQRLADHSAPAAAPAARFGSFKLPA